MQLRGQLEGVLPSSVARLPLMARSAPNSPVSKRNAHTTLISHNAESLSQIFCSRP